MATVPVYLLDSFAAQRFGGNPAGVVLLQRPASAAWMQGVAAELGAATTGFVDLPTARRGDAQVRFFTPRQEIDACGHVTVAIATVLVETGTWPHGRAAVTAAGGRFPLLLTEGDDGRTQVEVHQRLLHLERMEQVPGLDTVLGPATGSRRLPPVLAGTGLRHLLLPVETVADLAALPMVDADVASLSRALKVDTIGVFTLVEEDRDRVRVRMRDLCAGIGASEEPASGTTTGSLSFALADATVLTMDRPHLQVEMGVEMGRPSRLSVTLDFADGRPTLARLRGFSDRVLAGELVATDDTMP